MSIIIPAYNTEKYIHRAIESSLRQTHKNVEVLIIDDGSADDTLKTAEGYAVDGRVRVFTQENAGVSVARNRGISEARGEYMMFLDSDDWLEDDAVEVLLDAQAKYPDKVITSRIYEVSIIPESNQLRRLTPPDNLQDRVFTNFQDVIYSEGDSKYMLTAATKLFKSEIIRRNNLTFRDKFSNGEDLIFTFEYRLKAGHIVLISRAVINILFRPESLSRAPYHRRKNLLDGGNLIDPIQFMIDAADNDEEKTALKIRHTKSFIWSIRNCFRQKAPNEIIRLARERIRMYTSEFLSSRHISIIRKLEFIMCAYFPVPLARIAVPSLLRVYEFARDRIRRSRGREEILPS